MYIIKEFFESMSREGALDMNFYRSIRVELDEAEDNKKKVEELEAEFSNMQEELDSSESQVSDLADMNTKLSEEIKELKDEIKNLKTINK